MWLFVAGYSYRAIARAVTLRSPQSIGNIVRRELGLGGLRRCALTEFGRTVFVERSEALLQANWPAALAGDHAATQTCLGVFDEQARFYGLSELVSPSRSLR